MGMIRYPPTDTFFRLVTRVVFGERTRDEALRMFAWGGYPLLTSNTFLLSVRA